MWNGTATMRSSRRFRLCLQVTISGLPSTAASSITAKEAKREAEATASVQQAPGSESRPSSHLEPFYYAWRPATLYRKSHPPPPEFRIVILNARTHDLPSIWQFESIFAHIPIPGSDEELLSESHPPLAPTPLLRGAARR